MSNWQTKQGRDTLRAELKEIEKTFVRGTLDWTKINRQQEDALAVTVDVIKRQVRKGLVALKPGFSKEDALFQKLEVQDSNNKVN